jgi:hypothetical protein
MCEIRRHTEEPRLRALIAAQSLEVCPRADKDFLRKINGALLAREEPPEIDVERTLVAQEEGVEVQRSCLAFAG